MVCLRALPGPATSHSGLVLFRGPREADFTGRQKAIVREVNGLLAPLLGGPLARLKEPSPSELPLRSREVLRCLLEGDSDKQIAKRLGISSYTVNGHAKVIFRHFGVETRMELLARWVRRGWCARAAWLE